MFKVGDRVVLEKTGIGVCASKKDNIYFFVLYSELTPTTAP